MDRPTKSVHLGPPAARYLGDCATAHKKASVTPADDGVTGVLFDAARAAGIEVDVFEVYYFGLCVKNMVVPMGRGRPNLAFIGHVDAVPLGDLNAWVHPPFSAPVANFTFFGRGAVDMKGSAAAFVAAADRARRYLPLLHICMSSQMFTSMCSRISSKTIATSRPVNMSEA